MDSLKSRKKTLQLSTVALQPAACNFRPATCDLQPSNCNLRTADWNLLPSTPPRAGRVRKALDCLQLARGERKKPTHRFLVLMFEIFQLAINENLKSAMTPKVVLNSAISATRIYAYIFGNFITDLRVQEGIEIHSRKSIRGNLTTSSELIGKP